MLIGPASDLPRRPVWCRPLASAGAISALAEIALRAGLEQPCALCRRQIEAVDIQITEIGVRQNSTGKIGPIQFDAAQDGIDERGGA